MDKGWVKIHRSLLNWQWYDDNNVLRLLLHLILTVNFEDKKWHGIDVKAGSMILSWDTLSSSTKMTVQQCRTAMSKLEKCQEVTRESTNKYTVVSLIKWEQMQIEEIKVTSKITNKQQTNNKQITTTKEYKEIYIDKLKSFQDELTLLKNGYDNKMITEFYEYWIETDKKGKMRFDKEKTWNTNLRLKRWDRNNQKAN